MESAPKALLCDVKYEPEGEMYRNSYLKCVMQVQVGNVRCGFSSKMCNAGFGQKCAMWVLVENVQCEFWSKMCNAGSGQKCALQVQKTTTTINLCNSSRKTLSEYLINGIKFQNKFNKFT
jgi:hypothetical protein